MTAARPFELADLARRLANVVRPGRIEALDAERARARVRYAAEPAAVTAWLPWLAAAAGADRAWRAPTVGEQVLLLAPGGDLAAAFVLAGLYQDAFPPPATEPAQRTFAFEDGARLAYDAAAHALRATLPEGATAALAAPGGLTITGDLTLDGALTVKAAATLEGELAVAGTIQADDAIRARKTIRSDADVRDRAGTVQAMRVKFNAHTHTPTAASPVLPPQRM